MRLSTLSFAISLLVYVQFTVKGDDCIEPLILGFTIQNGSGTLVDRKYGDNTVAEYIGGGIISFKANPTINYN